MAENPQLEEQQEEAIRLKTLAESKFNSSKLKSALNYADRAHNLCPNVPGLTEMLTAFKILNSAKSPRKSQKILEHPFPSPELYEILGVTPFSSLSIIKNQYKKLALLLHPDKNTLKNASDEAFKLVNDAFQVFSDKGKRREYDTRLRLALLEEREESEEGEDVEEVGETTKFWTRCPKCQLRHSFEREYVGHRLVCPSCDEGFKAVEVCEDDEEKGSDSDEESVGVRESAKIEVSKAVKVGDSDDEKGSDIDDEGVGVRESAKIGGSKAVEVGDSDDEKGSDSDDEGVGKRKSVRMGQSEAVLEKDVEDWEMSSLSELVAKVKLKERGGNNSKKANIVSKRKMGSANEVVEREELDSDEVPIVEEIRKIYTRRSKNKLGTRGESGVVEGLEVEGSRGVVRNRKTRGAVENEVVERVEVEGPGGESRLAEDLEVEGSRVDVRRSSRRIRVVEREVEKLKNDARIEVTSGDVDEFESVGGDDGVEVEELTLAEMQSNALKKVKGKKQDGKKRIVFREEEAELNKKRKLLGGSQDMEVMTVEDSDFYDFDSDRVERSFKKGQVWAIYDDDDGMPRHYGLIDEVVSVNPFEVKMSWFDFQNGGHERLMSWERIGFHVSCGRFKLARKDTVKLLNIFSHLVDCERAARELYLIYPRKGSIWALYNNKTLDVEGGISLGRDERQYDIVVFLTTYSEDYGLSVAYLEKVYGYKAVFKRREFGYNAVRWLDKVDIRLFFASDSC